MGSVMKRCGCPTRHGPRGDRIRCTKKHGSWYFVAEVGDPAARARRQLKRGGFKTKSEAYNAMVEVERLARTGRFRDDHQLTVGSYLEAWLTSKSLECKPTTLRDYRRHVELELVPRLGALRLDRLR